MESIREQSSSQRLRTESLRHCPKFFIGCSPSMANSILSTDCPAAGCMVSVNALRRRVSDFAVGDWILDSGAFSEISRHGQYRHSVEEYAVQIERWRRCGNLLIAASQDFMCEAFILERTGLSVEEHQRLTIERYDALVSLSPRVPIMPVLQGYRAPEYLAHLQQYGKRLKQGAWVGIGSVCRRNGKPDEIADLLKTIRLVRPDLRLHGFGLKQLALTSPLVRECLYSCDSMAWSYPRRFERQETGGERGAPSQFRCDSTRDRSLLEDAHLYQHRVAEALAGRGRKQPTSTSGAGNGQGRKPKWNHSPTVPIRVPAQFAERLLEIARQWDEED